MEKLNNIKSFVYIIILVYCGLQVHSNLNQINSIIEPKVLFDNYEFNNLYFESNKQILNKQINFTYYEFSLYNTLIFEIIIYINIMFMLIIWLSNESKGLVNLLKKNG